MRNSVKILLLNEHSELLLMCADDPKTTSPDGKYHGRFWFTVGGKIETGETLEQAAFREIKEETGIAENEITLGPVVWFGEFDLVLDGILTHLKQTFIVAKTKKHKVALTAPTNWEKKTIQSLAWFSLEKIQNSTEIIYPVLLPKYLPDILKGNYPKTPLEIDLAIQKTS